MASNGWYRSGDGFRIPASGNPVRAKWDADYLQRVKDFFGHDYDYVPIDVPLDRIAGGHTVMPGHPRTAFYARLYKLGERVPPVIVSEVGTGWYNLLDGNRRQVSGTQAGKTHIPGLLVRERAKGKRSKESSPHVYTPSKARKVKAPVPTDLWGKPIRKAEPTLDDRLRAGWHEAEQAGSAMKSPAFRHVHTKKVVESPLFHNEDVLPLGEYEKGFWEDGFVDRDGNFFNREEAAKVVGMKRPDDWLESYEYVTGHRDGLYKAQPDLSKNEREVPPRLPPRIARALWALRQPGVLTDELRDPKYRENPNPFAGQCFVASNALYHLIDGANTGWQMKVLHREHMKGVAEDTHWFLQHKKTGNILDPTADQFEGDDIPYHLAVGGSTMQSSKHQGHPTRRAQVAIDRAQELLGKPPRQYLGTLEHDGQAWYIKPPKKKLAKTFEVEESDEVVVPLAKMALVHDDPKNPRTVFRIQNEEGEGPYRAQFEDRCAIDRAGVEMDDPESTHTYAHLKGGSPGPYSDFSEEDRSGSGFEKRVPLFGFPTPEAALRWFGDKGIQTLAQYGYHLHKMPAAKVWESTSGSQAMFHPAGGPESGTPFDWVAYLRRRATLSASFPALAPPAAPATTRRRRTKMAVPPSQTGFDFPTGEEGLKKSEGDERIELDDAHGLYDWFHLSYQEPDEEGNLHATPQVPKNVMAGEDDKSKRICVGPTIYHCIAGLTGADELTGGRSEGWEPHQLAQLVREDPSIISQWSGMHVYGVPRQAKVEFPSSEQVPDAAVTGEGWVTKPTALEHVGQLRVPKVSGGNVLQDGEWRPDFDPHLTKAEPKLSTGGLLFKSPDGRHEEWDYTHLLPEKARAEGYRVRMRLDHGFKNVNLFATKTVEGRTRPAGQLSGNWYPDQGKTVVPWEVRVEEQDRRKRLGLSMYEALYAHARAHLGMLRVAGSEHSTASHLVHKKLAARHGLDYNAKPNIDRGAHVGRGPQYYDREEWENAERGDFDARYGKYKYKLPDVSKPKEVNAFAEHRLPGSLDAEGYKLNVAHSPAGAIGTVHRRGKVLGHIELTPDGRPFEEWTGDGHREGLGDAVLQVLRGHQAGEAQHDEWNHPSKSRVMVKHDTPEFQSWFAGSVAKDGEGKPLRLFHGTSKDVDFSSFRIGQRGAWFTDDPEEASLYAHSNDSSGPTIDRYTGDVVDRNTRSRVIPVHLSIKNPYKPTRDEFKALKWATNYASAQRELFNRAKAAGHDGISMGAGTWVAFHPHQVKSIFNPHPTNVAHLSKSWEWAPEMMEEPRSYFNETPGQAQDPYWAEEWESQEPVMVPLDSVRAFTDDPDRRAACGVSRHGKKGDPKYPFGRPESCDEYINAMAESMGRGEKFPPLLLERKKDGTLGTPDGNHRIQAARRAGLTHVPAVIKRRVKDFGGNLSKALADAQPSPSVEVGPAQGSHITQPHPTYTAAAAAKPKGQEYGGGKNVWARNHSGQTNAGRTLMVQFSSDLLQGGRQHDSADDYYDKLYAKREGYHRATDFWEIPQWQAHLAHSMPDADHYTVRDPEEAIQFMNAAGYKHVAFSALDVNKDFVKRLAQAAPDQHVVVGGYTDMNHFAGLPNVSVHPSIKSFVEGEGREYRPGYDYRHFSGTKVIPRLTLSDGCRHQCTFCCVPKKVDEKQREEILQQADAFAEHLPSDLIYLNDKTYGQAQNHAMLPELYQRIRAKNPAFKGFVIQTTAAQMKKFTPQFIRDAGIKHVELGIESVNDPILKAHKKPANEALIEEAANKVREAGASLIPNIMVGLPGEDRGTYARTMAWLQRHQDIISHVNTYNLALYDESELGKKLQAVSAADRDENVQQKSWHTDPQAHKDFADSLLRFASGQLDRPIGHTMAKAEDFEQDLVKGQDLPGHDQVGAQLGSNPGGVYRNKATGEKHYVKFAHTNEHAQNEHLAVKLYQAMGVPTIDLQPLKYGKGRIGTTSKMVPAEDLSTDDDFRAAAKHFGPHAWLANWDALISGNTAKVNGQPTLLDAGGALMYRAMGEPKGARFGNEVGEFKTLRDPRMNAAARAFQRLTPQELAESVSMVARVPDETIDSLVHTYGPGGPDQKRWLADTLKARRQHLLQQAAAETGMPLGKAQSAHISPFAQMHDPESYLTYQSPAGHHLVTPDGNEQWFEKPEARDTYLNWHRSLTGNKHGLRDLGFVDRATRPMEKAEVDPHEPAAVIVMVQDGFGRTLWGRRRKDGKYTMPAGHVDAHEPPAQAAVRELHEEAGLVPEVMWYLGAGNGHEGPVYLYHCIAHGQPTIENDPDREMATWEWHDCLLGPPPQVTANLAHNPSVVYTLMGWPQPGRGGQEGG